MKKSWHFADEINLTPLLDVLFSILFIVMLTNMQNENKLQRSAEAREAELSRQISELQEQAADDRSQMEAYEGRIREMEEQIRLLEEQKSSMDLYNREAVILSVSHVNEEDLHVLVLHNESTGETTRLPMGMERLQYIRTRLTSLIADIVRGTDHQPVFIVFTCRPQEIFTEEFEAVHNEFVRQQAIHRVVFYKLIREE